MMVTKSRTALRAHGEENGEADRGLTIDVSFSSAPGEAGAPAATQSFGLNMPFIVGPRVVASDGATF
jgi:hypothetical protein